MIVFVMYIIMYFEKKEIVGDSDFKIIYLFVLFEKKVINKSY